MRYINTITITITVLFLACKPVGVADISTIPDDRITASTFAGSNQYQPYYGRLNGQRGSVGAWCTKINNDRTDYLQVDMGAVRSVCAVATQGTTGSHWITSFKLELSLDGTTFNYYMENNTVKVNKLTSIQSYQTFCSKKQIKVDCLKSKSIAFF